MALQSKMGNYAPPHFGAEVPRDQADIICGYIARSHLDLLTEAGWGAAGQYIADCITSGDFSALCHYDPDVLDLSAHDVYHIGQSLACYKKRVDLDIGVDRKGAAFSKFRESERRCALINSRFRAWEQGRFTFAPAVERVLHAAQRKISQVLGDCPSIADIPVRFGPGASTQVTKKNACLAVKLRSVPTCSANLAPRAEELLSTLYPYGALGTEIDVDIHDAQLSFVPKNAKTDRAICTEPSLNGLFQLGIGDLMADRLRTVGIDIRDQGPNQRAALYGSISGGLATLDLSSASDSVSIGLVCHLLPLDWAELLLDFRSDAVVYDGDRYVLEKISSMGNGFTFPLETLIFWALASASTDLCKNPRGYRVLVYGDDIVVPTDAVPLLRECLTELGFVLNDSKSFWTGSFRESCGCDYLGGINVRPCYVTGEESNGSVCALRVADIFRIHNYFFHRGNFALCRELESIVDPAIRLHGPSRYGDGHLHTQCWVPTLCRPRYKGEDKQYSGYTFQSWTFSVTSLKGKLRERVYFKRDKRWEYSPRSFFHVMRLATYIAYRRSVSRDCPLEGSESHWLRVNPINAAKRLRDWARSWESQTPSDGEAPWVTPGAGDVIRTRDRKGVV